MSEISKKLCCSKDGFDFSTLSEAMKDGGLDMASIISVEMEKIDLKHEMKIVIIVRM